MTTTTTTTKKKINSRRARKKMNLVIRMIFYMTKMSLILVLLTMERVNL